MNVIPLKRSLSSHYVPTLPGLSAMFVSGRRHKHDPFWLKENAEFLQIMAATGGSGAYAQDICDYYRQFLGQMLAEMRFFPQYYRFYLSIALDLHDIGAQNAPVAEVAHYIRHNDLAAGELGDLHRSEVRLLMRRANLRYCDGPDLDLRLMRFARNSNAFALPNRRAAYELTHIVFHNTNYGRNVVAGDSDLRLSLIHAGMIAWLEDNRDLLSEIVISLRFMGEDVPSSWVDAVLDDSENAAFVVSNDQSALNDDYHQYFVSNWAAATLSHPMFKQPFNEKASVIRMRPTENNPLRELSIAVMAMGSMRRGDWASMRWRMWQKLSHQTKLRIEAIEKMPEFEQFFQHFARIA